MPLQVLQRPYWTGTPREIGELFILHTNRREPKAVLLTHQLGWEVRLMIGPARSGADEGLSHAGGGLRLRGGVEGDDGMLEKEWR